MTKDGMSEHLHYHQAAEKAASEIMEILEGAAKAHGKQKEVFWNAALWQVVEGMRRRSSKDLFFELFLEELQKRRHLTQRVPDCIDYTWLTETVTKFVTRIETMAEGTAKKMNAEIGL